MTNRITAKQLLSKVAMINDLFGYDREAYTRHPDGTFTANVGTFVLDQSYGGYRLCQIASKSGAERDLTVRGTARETYQEITAFAGGAHLMLAQKARGL
jgi:hypothetical protein